MENVKHILVTNDDGVMAPGLLALVQALRPLGKVSVVAPDHNWSVAGHVKTLHRPLRVKETKLADGSLALMCDGAPSDCVALAYMGLLSEPIDLVVSGINPVPNLGTDLTYSGTVAAAMEGVIWGIQSIAVSLDGPHDPQQQIDFSPAAKIAARISACVLRNRLPKGVLLNVNVPFLKLEEIRGYRVTRLGERMYHDFLVRREDPFGRPYYWIGGDPPSGVPEDGTDIGALAAGFVSITPVHMDMTAHHFLSRLQGWDWESPAVTS